MTNCLLSLRSDVSSDDRKLWLAPYAAELKALADRKPLLKFIKPNAILAPTTPTGAEGVLSVGGGFGDSSNGGGGGGGSIGSAVYGLEIALVRGQDLAVKDINTSDPYVNILLLATNGARLAKQSSRVIKESLNPVWNETFTQWKASEVSALDRIRFEVWDKDFLSKDFMGFAEVTLAELRSKQLLERKASVRGGVDDFTQEVINFHLKLLPHEGKKNEGSNLVSGSIDVRIKYFKKGATTPSAPISASINGRPSMPSGSSSGGKRGSNDDLAYDLEHVGQTGSKRPPPMTDGARAGAGAPSPASSPAHITMALSLKSLSPSTSSKHPLASVRP